MDLRRSRDSYTSLLLYQRTLRAGFRNLRQRYLFEVIKANRTFAAIHRDLQARIDGVLAGQTAG
jgi:hypothetical protein